MREPIHKFDKFTDLKDMLKISGEKFGDRPAYMLRTEEKGKFKTITHKEFREEINNLGTKLIDMELKNKRIAVIGENRYEWGVAYLAVVTGTGVVVPLDKALPENEIESLIIRSEVEAIFYSKKYDDIMAKIQEKGNTKLRYYISMDLKENTEKVYSMEQLVKDGKQLVEKGNREFIDAKINPEEMQIMLFTSGTTAMSKAVKLSHKNIVSNLMDIAAVIKLYENDVMLSFLPLHHTFESTVGFLYPISKGCKITFCDGIRHIAENIKEYKITAMISVPALYEGIYKQVVKAIKKQGKWEKVQKGVRISNTLRKIGIDIRAKLFKEIHQSLGEDLRLMVAGGAALDPEIEKGYTDLGFCVYQGYGLTETSPVVTAETDKEKRPGSIGLALANLNLKIENPDNEGVGEITVKGPSVMLGYYKNPEETKKVLKDGWFSTGDYGYKDKDGFVYITGRKKDIIVLKNGKNVYPQEIEFLINKIPYVAESLVYSRDKDTTDTMLCAKIVYDKDAIKQMVGEKTEEEYKEIIWQEVKNINQELPIFKKIKNITITTEPLKKTTTQKVKRYEELKDLT